MSRAPTLDRLNYKSAYRRNLPHIQPVKATLFVTFRLSGALPKAVLETWLNAEDQWYEL
jgi:hypothetical protein